MYRLLKWFAVCTSIIMLFVLIGGALVTKTGSGMGCGRSWPLCHGELIPSNIDFALIVELSHRIVSGLAAIVVLVLSVWAWRVIGHKRETKFLALLSFAVLMLQALIGAAAVVWGQSSAVLALHFGISLVSFASVFLLTLLIFEADKRFDAETLIIDRRMSFHIIGIITYCYTVVYSGALVRHVGASLACPTWPTCTRNGIGLPTQMHEWIQMGHRAAAGLIVVWILYVAILAFRKYKHQPVIYKAWMVCAVLVLLQATTGALVVFTKLNIFVSLLHALIISCLFGVLSYLLMLVTRNKVNRQKQQ
ncbi:cytochrome c oxidase assembly protein subunit 15 [Bacillus tianshenii]|uniref:Heme A synthase n=1 Tax=Sutcliffiella tianshenii TaxID=1463404 RepID=A0ABS2P555_9BACI|nr:heme A synthase [Bacillus tianshenii]MBM7621733.1 cytochrome c oxidase assembly protein subunit 15 [Bacillus tianshenii]